MTFVCLDLAGVVVEVGIEYYPTYHMVKDFIVEQRPAFRVQCTQADYTKELKSFTPNSDRSVTRRFRLESRILLRKIAEHLIDYNIVLMHGAVIALEGRAYLFAGPSGIGKTTHVQIWEKHRADTVVVNGDKPFIVVDNDNELPLACGTPWSGKEGMHANLKVPLAGIAFLKRAETNVMHRISSMDALPMLLSQTYIPEDPSKMHATLQRLQRIGASVPLYNFEVNNYTDDCFDVAYSALHEYYKG